MAKRKSAKIEESPVSRTARSREAPPSAPSLEESAGVSSTQAVGAGDIRRYAATLLQLAAAMIVIGFLLTAMGVWMKGYMDLPNQGQFTFTQDGAERYVHSNEHFSKYVIRTDEDPHGRQDSHLKRMGFLLTTLYFQVVSNALHMTFAVEWRNLGVMLLLPIVLLVGAGFVLYRSMPRAWRRFDGVVMHMAILGVVHAVGLSILLILGYLASSSMRAIFSHSRIFYPPDFVGALPGGIALLILSGAFFGALAGVLVYLLHLSESPIFSPHKTPKRIHHR